MRKKKSKGGRPRTLHDGKSVSVSLTVEHRRMLGEIAARMGGVSNSSVVRGLIEAAHKKGARA